MRKPLNLYKLFQIFQNSHGRFLNIFLPFFCQMSSRVFFILHSFNDVFKSKIRIHAKGSGPWTFCKRRKLKLILVIRWWPEPGWLAWPAGCPAHSPHAQNHSPAAPSATKYSPTRFCSLIYPPRKICLFFLFFCTGLNSSVYLLSVLRIRNIFFSDPDPNWIMFHILHFFLIFLT
jgi:hypothetical protein